MALTKAKKEELVKGLEDVTKAKTIVFVSFDKLNVANTIALRRSLRSTDVGYRVTKKTLLKRSLDTRGFTGTMPEMPGEIAVAWSDDMLAPARGVYEFQKTHKDHVSIVGGVFEGMYKDKADMLAIATIPPREVLLAQIANLLNSPMQRLAIGISEVAKIKTA